MTSCATFADHLQCLETILTQLNQAGLKVNAKKSHFCMPEVEYLGYWITRKGIQPLQKKVHAIQNIAPPKKLKELRSFLGMVNYYRDMWIHRSDILTPLTRLSSKKVPYKWTDVEQTAFDTIKKVISKEVLLAYPDFNKSFHIHTDASEHQLGTVISQNDRPIAFYSRKLQPAQTRYTTTECELLSIVETLKEFQNILLGQQIVIHTDHKNLTYANFNTARIMRWHLIIEEFGPELTYIKGPKNVVADALSRLDLLHVEAFDVPIDNFGFDDDDLPEDAFPVSYDIIAREQAKDTALLNHALTHDHYRHASFHGGGRSKFDLLCYKNRICIPISLQKRVITWYHGILCHPGIIRTEETIKQHFYWRNMRDQITKDVSLCGVCQSTKKQTKRYGLMPEKEAEFKPWE